MINQNSTSTISTTSTSSISTSTTSNLSNRIKINDTKAGMENIDKEKINSIILKNTLKSKFYLKQQARDAELRNKATEKLNNYLKMPIVEINAAKFEADKFLENAEKTRNFNRTLVHIDMDAFYANVEIRDNPDLADKPMAVGSDSMLSTSNYIARKYGVRAAMPGFIARELCPDLIIVPCNFRKYRVESEKFMRIVSLYDSNYSAMSLDEAYLDITDHLIERSNIPTERRTFKKYYFNTANHNINRKQEQQDNKEDEELESITFGVDVDDCVREIRHLIYLETNLTASAGIACNLRLAKLCSDINKPNGQFRLDNDVNKILEFIEKLPVRKINGIGPSTSAILESYGINNCKDLYDKRDMIYLLETPNTFQFLMKVCKGLGSNRIEHDYDKKSLGHETTFSSKIANNLDELLKILNELSKEVSKELIEDNLIAQKVHIKMKTTSFEVYSRTRSLQTSTNDSETIYEAAKYLLLYEWQQTNKKLSLRLIGVRVSDLKDPSLINVQQQSKSMKRSLSSTNINKIDKFFNKKSCYSESTSNDQNDDDESLKCKFLETFFRNCPLCNEYLEGNLEFLNQHEDLCFKLSNN